MGDSETFGAGLRSWRLARGLSQRGLAALAHYSKSQISDLEREVRLPASAVADHLDKLLEADGDLRALAEFSRTIDVVTLDEDEDMERRELLRSLAALGITVTPAARAFDAIRASVGDLFSTDGSHLHDWQESVLEYGYTYLTTPPQQFIADLAADLVAYRLVVRDVGKDSTGYRDWCRVGTALAGLMAKSLSNLGHAREARQWWQTAQAASDRSGDIEIQLWVRGERIIHGLYEHRSADLLIRQANAAIELAQGKPCHGLANAITGRAQALVLNGQPRAAEHDLARAEHVLGQLPSHISNSDASINNWGEDRLRYTETWVHAYSGNPAKADTAAQRAVQLYTDHRTPAQIELLQAFARTQSGDVTEGIRQAHAVYEGLPREHRTVMVADLAMRVLSPVDTSGGARDRSDVIAYRELVAAPTS